MVCRKLVAACFALVGALVLAGAAQAAPLPDSGANVHEGVASCSNSVCHGKKAPSTDSPVLLNEYTTWIDEDQHSQAYATLRSDQSVRIAKNMGLPNAHTADVCLDCHADNVPKEKRGRRFQITEGVGCEACHGGSGKWLESHAEEGTSHADNLAKGMYPTEEPVERARLCLSCHLGTERKFATHEIMGAGHPRLAFELELYTVFQPRHYETDADYRARKPFIPSVNMWLAGLLVSSEQTLELLQEDWFTKRSLVPELSFFQCHACHHPLDDLRWQPEGGAAALPPGSVRLNDASLLVLQSVLSILGNDAAAQIQRGINELHQSTLTDRNAVVAAAAKLEKILPPLEKAIVDRDYNAADMKRLREGIIKAAANQRYRHFTAAEQAYMAVENLCIELNDDKRLQANLDEWFEIVEKENEFNPQKFAASANRFLGAL